MVTLSPNSAHRILSADQSSQQVTGCNSKRLGQRLQRTDGHIDPALLDTPYEAGVGFPSFGEIALTPPALSAVLPHIVRKCLKQLTAGLLLRHRPRNRDDRSNLREYTIRRAATRLFATAPQDDPALGPLRNLRLPARRYVVKKYSSPPSTADAPKTRSSPLKCVCKERLLIPRVRVYSMGRAHRATPGGFSRLPQLNKDGGMKELR